MYVITVTVIFTVAIITTIIIITTLVIIIIVSNIIMKKTGFFHILESEVLSLYIFR